MQSPFCWTSRCCCKIKVLISPAICCSPRPLCSNRQLPSCGWASTSLRQCQDGAAGQDLSSCMENRPHVKLNGDRTTLFQALRQRSGTSIKLHLVVLALQFGSSPACTIQPGMAGTSTTAHVACPLRPVRDLANLEACPDQARSVLGEEVN